MKTAAQRIARYNARMDSALVGPAMGSQLATMDANYTAYVNAFIGKQQQVAELLDAADAPLGTRFAYHAFNNEVYHAVETLSDVALATEVCILETKYVALGLTEALLDSILTAIYTLPTCIAP